MKRSRRSPYVWLKGPLDPTVPIVAKRFVARVLILSLFAALPFSHDWGFPRMFVALAGFNGPACLFAAMILREKMNTRAVNHFDEALGMAALGLIGQLSL